MDNHGQLTDRYRQLLAEAEPVKNEWVAMLRLCFSSNPADRMLFDAVAFERVNEQMGRLDRKLVEIEEAIPDDLPEDLPGFARSDS